MRQRGRCIQQSGRSTNPPRTVSHTALHRRSETPTIPVSLDRLAQGVGVVRYEWRGSLSGCHVDKLFIADPGVSASSVMRLSNCPVTAKSFYLQDPTGSWQGESDKVWEALMCGVSGIRYYKQQLQALLSGYSDVCFIGDSMGASAALLFSELATRVLAFVPIIELEGE